MKPVCVVNCVIGFFNCVLLCYCILFTNLYQRPRVMRDNMLSLTFVLNKIIVIQYISTCLKRPSVIKTAFLYYFGHIDYFMFSLNIVYRNTTCDSLSGKTLQLKAGKNKPYTVNDTINTHHSSQLSLVQGAHRKQKKEETKCSCNGWFMCWHFINASGRNAIRLLWT